MKFSRVFQLLLMTCTSNSFAQSSSPVSDVEQYLQQAQMQHLSEHVSWKRFMYAPPKGQKTAGDAKRSEVRYASYFYNIAGAEDIDQELQSSIRQLFQPARENESIRCRFPARSNWLIQQLNIPEAVLPPVTCPELEHWLGQIKPYKATLIYATDFMGNPSSMFGHTLLRLDPKDQQELNLVSYAINYAATVVDADSFSFAWKGLTGQYPGEYSLMPYYRKVKEYGDFESRDLWEYELALTPAETRMLVEHIWELKHVQFPYYFIHDNCAYRLLGLIDLVLPEANLQQRYRWSAIPVQTIKTVEQQGLIKHRVYRPALETQLLAQARQHGTALAKAAAEISQLDLPQIDEALQQYSSVEQARILEMAYDHLYLQLVSQKVTAAFAEPRLRQILAIRSRLMEPKQRQPVEQPKQDPLMGHHAHQIQLQAGQVQKHGFAQLGLRAAYHDLIDPQGGFRTGTQLKFLQGSVQYREDRQQLKLHDFQLMDVNAYAPLTPFKTPISWGFGIGWQQEALNSQGQFSDQDQHGVLNLSSQFGLTLSDQSRQYVCFAQVQNHVQAGDALQKGWRVGLGPRFGCQNVWSENVHSVTEVALPYWEDQHQWQLKLNSQLQYQLSPQNSLRLIWQYQQQNHLDWQQFGIGYSYYFD